MQHKEGLRPLLFLKLSKLNFDSIEKALNNAFQEKVIQNKTQILRAIQERILNS